MTDTGKVCTGSLCAHLDTCHLKLLLAAQGLPSDGTRLELETQLEKELQKRTAGTWVWEKLPEVLQPCFGGSMVEWNGGIYLFGGYGGDGQASNKLFSWRPGYKAWEQLLPVDGEMVPPALYHHSAVVYKQEMWVLGSISTGRIGERTPCFAAYNFEDNSWRRIEATGPTPLCITQCTTYDACVCDSSVIVGSQDGICALNMETLVWNILHKSPGITGFWTNYHLSIEGRDLYMFGWSDAHIVQEYSTYSNTNEVYMYRFNLDTNVWTKITYSGEAPKTRDRFSSVRVQNKWVVHGGTGSMIHGKSLNETFIYNFSTRTWVELEHSRYQPQKRAHYSCVKFGKDRVIFSGGRLDWNGRNQSLSTPCYSVESLRLVDSKSSGDNQHQALMVIKDAARSIVMNPIRRTLFDNKHLSDVTLVIDDTEILAHKLVLAEGSTFFERMWESGMLEDRAQRVQITGVGLEVMEVVLKYLYGCLEMIPSDDVVGVFYAADMYEVPGLQAECLNLMLEDMSYSSLVDYWHLGYTHNFEEMANGCVDFAADNPVAFLNSESFQMFKMSDPALAKHLLESVCTRLKHEFHENEKIEANQPVDGMAECALLEIECKTNIDKLADEHAKLEKMVLELDAKLGH